jgi:hypothetical protein
MKQTITRTLTVVSVVVSALCAGCATMTEAEREEREMARVEFREQFVFDREYCRSQGGRFIFNGAAEVDRDGIPKTKTRYQCI